MLLRQATVQEPGGPSAIDLDYKDTQESDPETDTVDNGQLITTTLPNGIVTRNILDPAGRLLKTHSAPSGGSDIQRFIYEYELASGKQTKLRSQETDKDGNTIAYDYDDLDRLTSAISTPGNDYSYDYDDAGNLIERQVNTATPTLYSYNEANQLCWRVTAASTKQCDDPPAPSGADSYGYDADGNQTSESGGNSWTFNRRSQMTGRTISGSSLSFAYAGPGQAQRISIGSTQVVNNVLGVASHTAGTDATYYTRDNGGAFLSQRKPSASSPDRRIYPLTDALGSTRALVNENGTVVRRYAFDPYGRDTSTGSWTASTRFQFASGERHDTGNNSLDHFGQRYYLPTNGRWTQQDPLNQASDLRQANRYTYTGCDPVNVTDPTGMVSLGWDDLADVAFGMSDLGTAAAAGLALTAASGACLAAIPGSGPAAPLVAIGCGTFIVGNAGIFAWSMYSAYNDFGNVLD